MTMAGGKLWTEEDVEYLLELKKDGSSLEEIADALGRSVPSVTQMISKLKVKAEIMKQRAAKEAKDDFTDDAIEEYSEEEMRAATKGCGTSGESGCVTMPVIPCGDGKAHPLGKLPHDRSVSVRALERPLRDAKTVLHTVRDLIAMLHADEDRKVDGILAFGALLANTQRLVDDLEELVRE